ncbi:hypothetical protein GWK47_031346 [Chionoecetes opilio]|uniref:Uncharacterized protein n=1 Tax=Chionoecetes opilio TaxID=41210 RepID=A0A8J4YIZ0_CHIOP|nr:hypothetical protein GWK47_031346 [Chionoecetes opilio]
MIKDQEVTADQETIEDQQVTDGPQEGQSENQDIRAKPVVGPERKPIITLDLDLYNCALQIQQSVGNDNWILRAGALHIAFAALHSLGKTVDGSGIDTCSIESGTYTSAALRGIYGDKAYKRGIEYHVTTCLAITMMRFDAMFSVISLL